MSLVQMSYFSSLAISFYEIDVNVSDYQYVTQDGEDKRVLFQERTIKAAVDPSRSKQMERIFGGSIGNGDIGVYTLDTLYIYDSTNINEFVGMNFNFGNDNLLFAENESGDIGPTGQSYVYYQGLIYRVSEVAQWGPQINARVYLCKRHMKQDGL
jgi:hypothetical protein